MTTQETSSQTENSEVSRADLQRAHTRAPYQPTETDCELPDIATNRSGNVTGRMILSWTQDGELCTTIEPSVQEQKQ